MAPGAAAARVDTCAHGPGAIVDVAQLYDLHAHWAATIAKQVHRRVAARSCDREDCIQNARIGLLEAINRYDACRGVEFRSFAARRVRGAVFNGLRAMFDERRPNPHAWRFEDRLDSFEDDAGESPLETVTRSVVGLALGYLLEDLAGARAQAHGCTAFEFARTQQLQRRLMAAVQRLPTRLRAIIEAHYFQHVPFVELAARYSVTKGRISQQHHAALAQLRGLLRTP